jgi:hypothetical protein
MIQEALDITIKEKHHSQEHLDGGFGMNLTFERDDFLDSLHVLQSVASGRNTSPIPSNVLIHAKGSTIECMATDMEIGIRIKVEGTVREEGAIVVSAQKLEDIVKEWHTEKPVGLATTAKDQVEITCGDSIHQIVGFPDAEFPQLPSVDEGAFTKLKSPVGIAFTKSSGFRMQNSHNSLPLMREHWRLMEKPCGRSSTKPNLLRLQRKSGRLF